jgi:hypothetical protein
LYKNDTLVAILRGAQVDKMKSISLLASVMLSSMINPSTHDPDRTLIGHGVAYAANTPVAYHFTGGLPFAINAKVAMTRYGKPAMG